MGRAAHDHERRRELSRLRGGRPRAADDAGVSDPAARFGTEFITDDVTRVDFSEYPYRVWVGETEYQAETVILATGAVARQLGLESEQKLQGAGVSYCAVCDAAFFKDREVVVVGGGDSAMEEAVYLAKFASKVRARASA